MPLTERVESLKHVTFQKELGSYHWKTEQNLAVAKELAAAVAGAEVVFDEAAVMKAVWLAKTDLTTELVKEFTELQGIIGGLYARAQGLGERVAVAIYDQYRPSGTDDKIPTSIGGQIAGAGGSHSDDHRDVRDRTGADGIEGPVCAAACGQCDCEDPG